MTRKTNLHRKGATFLDKSPTEIYSILINDILSIFFVKRVKMNTNVIGQALDDANKMTFYFI